MKKVSVVIPMYYEEEVANECYQRMKSVLTAIPNYEYEIVFINDGSKDKTLEILEEIAKEDKNVKVLVINVLLQLALSMLVVMLLLLLMLTCKIHLN